MPYLDLHFGNKQVSDNLFPHGIGSKGKMWDLQFIYADGKVYDKNLNVVDVNGNNIPLFIGMSVAPYANLGVFEEYEVGSKTVSYHLIDMKTFKRINIITESKLIPNSYPASYGSSEAYTFLNGDLIIMNYASDMMTLYDKKGMYKKSITGIFNSFSQPTGLVSVHHRKGIIAVRNGYTGLKFYNKNLEFLFQVEIPNVSLSFKMSAFLPSGDLLIKEEKSGIFFRKVYIDYENKKIIKTATTPLTNDQRDEIYLFDITKDKMQFRRDYRGLGKSTLLEFDNNLNFISETTQSFFVKNLVLVDGKYYHTKDDNGRGGLFKTYEIATNKLVLEYNKSAVSPSSLRSLRESVST
ncbi:hypothetical protein MLA2C4_11890 [Bacillus mobilis]|nr:hypothetical protein MLA2C4_11890 [Bacillus mobilis]